MSHLPLTNVQARDIAAILHPYTPLHRLETDSPPLVMASGKGVYIRDTQGKEYIEGMSGLWCAGLGFGDEELIEAAIEQLRTLPYYHLFGSMGTEPATELAEKLKELAPIPVSKVFFTSSGSEANDTQVKLAWYFNNAMGRPEKKKIISRIRAYHGVTIMTGSMTGLPFAHDGFDLPVDRVLHADCPHYYRYGEDGESEEEFVRRLVANLRELIEREGPETIAAMIAEPIMGAGGVIVPPKGYFEAIKEVLDEHDIFLIGDEVITGFGRTGNWWGAQSTGMVPTTISVAKQMTSAYAPLGAVMVPEQMYQAYLEQSKRVGTFGHGYTYGGHPLGCALGTKAIEIYQKRDIVGHVRNLAPRFAKRLERISEHPLVGEVRHCGLIGGVELVADHKTKQSFNPKLGVGPRLSKFLLERGAVMRAIGDTVAICPPMVIKEDELDELFNRLETALDDAEGWVSQEGLRAA